MKLRQIAAIAIFATPIHAQSCESYTTGYCSQFVNYPVYLAGTNTIASTEAAMKAGGLDLLLMLNSSTPADRPCVSTYLEWICYASYPDCTNGTLLNVPCKSVCESAVSQCQSMFQLFGKMSLLPNCADNVLGLAVPYGTTSDCLGYVAPSISPTPPPSNYTMTCPSFLIKDPAYSDSNPNQLPEIGNGYRTTCLDDITAAMHGNSSFCIVQSFVQAFSALLLLFWINVFMVNLHLTIVWRKDLIGERYAVLGVVAVLYAGIPATSLTVLGTAASNGFMCMADGEHVRQWLLYPMGVVGWPGVFLTFYTVGFLVVKLMSAPAEAVTMKFKPSGGDSDQRSSGLHSDVLKTVSKWGLNQDSFVNEGKSSQIGKGVQHKLSIKPDVADDVTKCARRLTKHREKMWSVV
ncbi:hypothetical protein HDU98_010457, partial [Podochytrium sp. JEL0797]